jgi:DNA mismatch repair protein MSH6
MFFSLDPKCRQAATEADKAMKMDKEERSTLVVAMDTSSSEEEEEEEENMDVSDGALFLGSFLDHRAIKLGLN